MNSGTTESTLAPAPGAGREAPNTDPMQEEARAASQADAAAARWLRQQARLGGAWARLAVAAGLVQALAVVGQAAALAWMLHALVIQHLGPWAHPGWLAALAVCFVLRALAGVVREEAGQRASARIREHMRAALLDHLYRLGPAWRDTRQAGSLASILLEQVEALEGFFARYRPQQLLAGLVPLVFVLAVLPYSWAAAAILILTAPLIPVFMILVGWGARARQTRQMQALQRMSGYFLDALRGLPTLRVLGAQDRQAQAVERMGEDFRVRTMSVLRLAFLSGTVLEFFASVAIALTAVYLGFSLLGYLDFGFYGHAPELSLAFFILLLAPEFYQPLRDLGTHYHARAEALAASRDLLALMREPEVGPAGGAWRCDTPAPALALAGVHFRYRDGEPVLQGCDLRVPAGRMLAIVGASGSGKTTILRLLLGQLAPQAGQVLVEGRSLADADLAAWREGVGWMSQHPQLLSASLADNLRVARLHASDDELVEALGFAGLGAWFETLPQGLATALGEGARLLSGGQLRRLALARVWLRPAGLLLLDEPTASLDAQTEDFVVRSLGRLRQGRTVVMLSHRQAPLALADEVLELRDGCLFPARVA